MEALKAIKIIGNQNDGRAVFLCLPNSMSNLLIGHTMEALKAIKIIGNQNDGRAVFLCLPNTG